jgi:L-ascorbate metabolism protein UlaG (beta-lactamase superfamily)
MRSFLTVLALLVATTTAHADTKTKVKWFGHAAFEIDLPSGKTILIDPWITNPSNPTGKDDVKTVKADLILVTHGHFDHVGDASEIAKRTKAKLFATFDLGNAIVGAGYPKEGFGQLGPFVELLCPRELQRNVASRTGKRVLCVIHEKPPPV